MNPITVEQTQGKITITFPEGTLTKADITRIVDHIYLERLAQTVGFDASIETLGEDIKREWWQANKDRFIPQEDQ